MEQASERERLFDGLPERKLPEPRAPVKGSFARTGILPSQALKSLITAGEIRAAPEIKADQIQPASLDLRLGKVAYRIRASFLPGPNATVRDKLSELKFHEIDLTHGAVLEAGCVYLVPLIEQLNLRATIAAFANPKSSIGRIDVFTRLIADRQDSAFYGQAVWEDDGHVLFTAYQDGQWSIVRMGVDGAMEYAVPPTSAGDELNAPFVLETR